MSRVGCELYEVLPATIRASRGSIRQSSMRVSLRASPVRTNRDDRTSPTPIKPCRCMATPGCSNECCRIRIFTFCSTRIIERSGRSSAQAVGFHTGPVDDALDYRFGKLPTDRCNSSGKRARLPWRNRAGDQPSQRSPVHARHRDEVFVQPDHPKTSLVHEFPTDQGDPYFTPCRPLPTLRSAKHQQLADATSEVQFLAGWGRCWGHYNMDQVVAQALSVYARTVTAQA